MSFHTFRGQPSTKLQRRTNAFTQASTRHIVHSFDQHGRQWSWEGDNKSGMPTSILSPLFSAPFIPDNQFILVNPDNTSECYVDYPAMYRERAERLREHHRQAVAYAVKHKQPVPAMGQYSDEITETVGAAPEALELVAAAAQENPWVLGFSDVPDPRLVPFLKQASTAIAEIMDTFDFAPASYARATAGEAVPGRREKPKRFTSFASLAELQDAAGVDETGAPVAGAAPSLEAIDEEVEGGFESIESTLAAPVGAEPSTADDDALFDIEDDEDAEALGGRTVDPKKSAIVARQAPMRPTQTAVARKRGREVGTTAAKRPGPKATKAFDHESRPSMADGAMPYIPDVEE